MAIDGNKIALAVMEGSHIRDSKGIIPIFGVYLSLFFAQYYNMLSFDFEKARGQGLAHESASLLVEAAQECGYATFQGIRSSQQWDELVRPMIETREDEIDCFAAIAVAFGWGDLRVRELTPGEKLVIRANDSYEAAGYIRLHGLAKTGKCYMLRGVSGAFMDLVYGRDYPDGCFCYRAEESFCRAKGDSYCEFTAQRSSVPS
jgi:hypothetical protein